MRSSATLPWNTGDAECKRAALRQHGMMRLNAMLESRELWDDGAILDRGDHLLGHANRIWSRPTFRQG